ncbi:MAG: DUF4293 domain-containing protein [Opitutaceae bacterium]|nr:DUF4293 domain-containing protein [Cytophagales bacterium]
MIQRIQTIFLTIVIAAMVGFCFSTVWVKVNEKTADEIILTPISLTYYNGSVGEHLLSNISVAESSMIHILILAGIVSLLALVSIVSFKKRVSQMKFGFVNTLLLIIIIALLNYQIVEGDKLVPHPLYGDYKLGFFLPIFALLFNIAANYYIKKDEDLVRSADRIR